MTIEEAKLAPLDKIEQQSFDKRRISLAKISHSHLSNCYWCSMFFQNPKILRIFEEHILKVKKEKHQVVIKQDYEKAALLRDEEKELLIKIDHLKVFPINEHMT